MNNQSYEITVDTRKSISHSNIEFSQNNLNISELIFNITEDGTNFTLNDTDKIIVYFEKPDKTVVFQDKEVELLDKEKGKIKVLLTSQTLVKAGDVKGQISIERIEDGTRKRVNTYDFSFKVRSSIASNDSIESTNEFQIFDKIMVAGEKFKDFEDEDFDELIAAGELAKGALPKSGGTMTGNIDMDTSVGSKSKGYRWRDAAGTMYGLETSTTGELILYDYKAAARIWQYDPVAKRFSVNSDGNLLKTTGGTITGTTIFEAGDLRFKNAANDILFRNNTSGIFSFYDIAQNQVVWSYNPTTKEFTVNSASNLLKKTGDTMTGNLVMSNALAEINFKDDKSEIAIQKTSSGAIAMWDRVNQTIVWQYFPNTKEFRVSTETNLVKKTGDTMTGNFNFDVSSGEKSLVWRGGTTNIGFISGSTQNWRLRDWANSKDVFSYDGKTFNVLADSNLVTKTKDGRATITVTADAELISANGVIADRRGNTVTLRAPIRRKAGSTNGLVFTLPVDMRPTMTLSQTVITNDGATALITLNATTGEVFLQALSTTIVGKDINIIITYVAD